MYREQTKVVKIGDRVIGGGNPILIQSMTNTKTEDVEATVAQILELEAAGCDIIRSTVPTLEAAKALGEIKKRIHIPIVADIHFDYRMAIAAIENGAELIAYNPWSAFDLLSTSNGIAKRYGFIYVDKNDDGTGTLKRYKKDSFYWYQSLIESNSIDLDE